MKKLTTILLSLSFSCPLLYATLAFPNFTSSDADHILQFKNPLNKAAAKKGETWYRYGLPIGNGSLGGVIMAGIEQSTIQLNIDSLWTGNENTAGHYRKNINGDVFGAYQNLGTLVFEQTYPNQTKSNAKAEGFQRQLDIAKAIHSTTWKYGGVTYTREAIASYPDQVIVWRISANKPGQISGNIILHGAHTSMEKITVNSSFLQLKGALPNKLKYAAQVKVINKGGSLLTSKDSITISGADELLVILAANTNYVMDRSKGWMQGDPSKKVQNHVQAASQKSWEKLLAVHTKDYRSYYDRVKLDLGKTKLDLATQPLNVRINNYRKNAKEFPRPCLDPELEAMLFNYGRYLLIASSREGTLPANLQGIWNNSNTPAWCADFHTNINMQMNYWLAETTNLPELTQPLFDMLVAGVPVFKEHTKKEYGADSKGFVTRMALNPFGGSGWNWNIEGTAWLSQHFWEHYQFSKDKTFLKKSAWPWMRDVSEFWLPRLKKLPDGSLVVPHAWSHEHGPYEDGTAHAQQLMFDLFTSTLKAAQILDTAPELQKRLKDALAHLYGPHIGSWGQLMEWMEEKPSLEKSHHRHTSHLFAVYPGNQITRNTPKLLEGAKVSLLKRGEVGDSRVSWTWAWRTALWARMGEGDRAHGCIAGFLAYNMQDNLWAYCPPFQIDGNLGIPAGMAEMFLQSQRDVLEILPALPKVYPTGSVKGLRARGNILVDIDWKNGKFAKLVLHSKKDQTVEVSLPHEKTHRKIKLKADMPFTIGTQ